MLFGFNFQSCNNYSTNAFDNFNYKFTLDVIVNNFGTQITKRQLKTDTQTNTQFNQDTLN